MFVSLAFAGTKRLNCASSPPSVADCNVHASYKRPETIIRQAREENAVAGGVISALLPCMHDVIASLSHLEPVLDELAVEDFVRRELLESHLFVLIKRDMKASMW